MLSGSPAIVVEKFRLVSPPIAGISGFFFSILCDTFVGLFVFLSAKSISFLLGGSSKDDFSETKSGFLTPFRQLAFVRLFVGFFPICPTQNPDFWLLFV
jgi:hypothetical protein